MISSKQRAYLRGLANTIEPVVIIGKEGLEDGVIESIDKVLEKRELIKVKILDTADLGTRDTCSKLSEILRAEPVQSIGSKLVLYRRATENPKIILPKASKKDK
ncbi:MAG: ribosome assembly RNA-binding protein YhbY [Filifactoraceae bacterium]